MLQRSISRPRTGTINAEQTPPNDSANEAVLRCQPISAMIGFRNTPKVKPSTGPLHTNRPLTAPTTTHHGFVKLSRIVSSLPGQPTVIGRTVSRSQRAMPATRASLCR